MHKSAMVRERRRPVEIGSNIWKNRLFQRKQKKKREKSSGIFFPLWNFPIFLSFPNGQRISLGLDRNEIKNLSGFIKLLTISNWCWRLAFNVNDDLNFITSIESYTQSTQQVQVAAEKNTRINFAHTFPSFSLSFVLNFLLPRPAQTTYIKYEVIWRCFRACPLTRQLLAVIQAARQWRFQQCQQ